MRAQSGRLLLIGLVSAVSTAHAQASRAQLPAPAPTPAPTTKAAVGQWDVGIVRRAAKILGAPALWNRADSGDCAADAKTFSISCALEKAVEEAAGVWRDGSHPAPGAQQPVAKPDCLIRAATDPHEGTCGPLFDEVPVFTLSRAKAVTTGKWRADIEPSEVWAGTMSDAEYPVLYEADELVGLIAAGKYKARLVGYNNDSTTTFDDVQAFFRALEDRVARQGTADLAGNYDKVEIEVHAGGTGVIRTYTGWFAVSGFTASSAGIRFQIDTAKQLAPSALDREILQRAATIISADSVWNRADNRKCPPTATTWSIYCAVERAMIEVTGGFHHRRPASELVRVIVDERTKARTYPHRLMGYNNDPSTHLSDVQSLFAEAIARIKRTDP